MSDTSSDSADEDTSPPSSSSPETSSTTFSTPKLHSGPVSDLSSLSVHPSHPSSLTLFSPSATLKLISTVRCSTINTSEPPLAIRCEIIDSTTRSIIRYAAVEFHREGLDAVGHPRRTHSASWHKSTIGDRKVKCIRFTYSNALVYGVDNIPSDWPGTFKSHLNDLACFRLDGTTSLELAPTHSPDPRRSALIDSLNTTSQTLWNVCRAEHGGMITSWKALEEAYKNETATGLGQKRNYLHFPASHCYASPEEAHLKLTHAVYADWLWEQENTDNICKGAFMAQFYKTQSGHVLAQITRNCRIEGKLRTALDDNMLLEIRRLDGKVENGLFVGAGKVTTNLPAALGGGGESRDHDKFVLLLYTHSTSDWASVRAVEPGKHAAAIRVTLTIKDYESSKIQINAMKNFFDRSSGLFKQWWPGFLGETSGDITSTNFLKEELGVSQREIDDVVSDIAAKARSVGMRPNLEQMSILRGVGTSFGGWSLWRGPPGTGKTTLIALMIDALLRFEGVGVYACSPSNGSVNRLYACIKAWMFKSGVTDPALQPLRIFRKYNELRYLKSITHPSTRSRYDSDDDSTDAPTMSSASEDSVEDEDDATVLDQWCKLQQEAEEKRLMDEPKNGLMAAVVEAIRTGNLHETSEARSTREPRTSKEKRQQDHYNKAKESLGRLQDHLKGFKTMSQGKKFDQDIQSIRNQILGTRRLVVSTVGNATNLLVREAIYRDCRVIVIIVDEQSLDTDAGTITLLADLIDYMRIMGEYGDKSPVVQMILVGDENQGAPLIKSYQERVNIFGAQLAMSTFERLVKVGFPIKTLREQHRMAPVIRCLPSDRCYGGKLRDSEQVKQRELMVKKKGTIREIIKNPTASEDSEFRHLLVNVPSSSCYVEDAPKSRVNDENRRVTISLIKYLVGKKVVAPQDIVLLVFYHGQKRAYEKDLMRLETRMPFLNKGDFFGCVQTSDSFQGRERTCVILDLVVTDGARLGNVGDEKRMNVACSRARDFFFVVGSLKVLDGRHFGRSPYVCELLKRLKDRDALIDVGKLSSQVAHGEVDGESQSGVAASVDVRERT